MKLERRQPTRAEWQRITSRRSVVRRITLPKKKSKDRKGGDEMSLRAREVDGGVVLASPPPPNCIHAP
jgi:hypothetical protein